MQTQTQKSPPLPPADPLGARFCKWFNHGWHWIYGATPAPGEKIQWRTENRYPLEPRNLWQEYQDPEKIIGLRFDNEATRYCMIDIDRGSPYHPALDRAKFNSVLAGLETIGLCRPLLIRSSDSEGIHIYYFLPEPVPTFSLACAVRFALEDAGLSLRSGWLEIFPNTKAYSEVKIIDYNGHRLPLQAGSYWLDSDGLPISNDLGQFLDAADLAAASQDMDALNQALAAAGKNRRRLRSHPGLSEDAEAWKLHLETRINPGWSGSGQTNSILRDLGKYGKVFLRLKGKDLIDYIEARAKSLPGYEQFCNHQHEIRKKAQGWTSCTESNEHYVEYRGFPKRRGTYKQVYGLEAANNVVRLKSDLNEQRSNEANNRICRSIAHLKELGKLPATVVARAEAIIKTAKELFGKGVSMLTLRKQSYLSLWHPSFDQADTATEFNNDNTSLDGRDVELFNNANSIQCLQQPSMQTPNRLISEGESLTTSSSSAHADSNTSSKQPLIHDGILSSIAALNCSTEIESVVREVLPKPLPDVESPTWITPPSVVCEDQPELESLEPSPLLDSSSLDHTPPSYEGVGANARQPEPPPRGGGVLPGIVPFEHSSGEREGENVQSDTTGTVSPATPAAPDAPATPTAPTVPATPTAPAAPAAPATPTAPTAPTVPTAPATPTASATPTAPTAPATPIASATANTGIERELTLEQKIEVCRQLGCNVGQVWRDEQLEISVNGLIISVESFMQRPLSSFKELLQPYEVGLNSCREAIASIKQKKAIAKTNRLAAICQLRLEVRP